MPRGVQDLRRKSDLSRFGFGAPRRIGLIREILDVLHEKVVLRRNLHRDRARRTALRKIECATDRPVDIPSGCRTKSGLRHRCEQRELVDVVQLKRLAGIRSNPARQDHERNVVHQRFGDARQAVRDAGAGDNVHNPDAVRGS